MGNNFRAKYKEVFNYGKEVAKEVDFWMLGNSFLHLLRSKPLDESVETERIQEIMKVFQNYTNQVIMVINILHIEEKCV